MKLLKQLQQAIRATHGAESKHLSSTPVREEMNGDVIFDGEVETFALLNHPKAQICYAWGYEENGRLQTTCVLGIDPVTNPITAVRAAVVSKAKRAGLLPS